MNGIIGAATAASFWPTFAPIFVPWNGQKRSSLSESCGSKSMKSFSSKQELNTVERESRAFIEYFSMRTAKNSCNDINQKRKGSDLPPPRKRRINNEQKLAPFAGGNTRISYVALKFCHGKELWSGK